MRSHCNGEHYVAKKLFSAALPRAPTSPTSRQRTMLVSCLCLCSASRRAIGLSGGQTLPHVAIATRVALQLVFMSRALIPVVLPLLVVLESCT